MSYRPIRPGEVFKYRPESATEQNGNAAKKKEEEDEEAKKKKKKGLSRWRLRIKSTSIFGFKFFFSSYRPISFSRPKHTDIRLIRSDLSRVGASRGIHVAGRGLTWHGCAVSGVPPASPRPAKSDAGAAPLESRSCIPGDNQDSVLDLSSGYFKNG